MTATVQEDSAVRTIGAAVRTNGSASNGTDTETQIVLRDLWKVFGRASGIDSLDPTKSKKELLEESGLVVALKDVSLEIKKGETFVIMGLSGSGKSTLLRCINRLVEPTRGQVLIDGENVAAMNGEQLRELRRHKIGMVFQHFALLPFRNILDNVAFGLEVRGVGKKERAEEAMKALALVGLQGWEKHLPHELSGGMQQRVGLARALATNPEVMLLDEPFSALDPLIRREMQDEFAQLASLVQKTVIFVTHDLNEALKLGDRIAIMQDGAVVQVGSPMEIVTTPANDYVNEFVRDIPKMKVLTAHSVMQRPGVLVTRDEPLGSILEQLKKRGRRYAFVLDRERKFAGIVGAEELGKAMEEGHTTMNGLCRSDAPQAGPESTLEDLVPMSASSDIPVAVVDDARRLLGVVPMASVLRGIAGHEN